MPGSAKASPEGVMNRISWPFSLSGHFTRLPVMVSMSSSMKSTMSLKAWGWMPKWLPVRVQLATGSRIQLMLMPTRCSSSRAIMVTSAVSMP